MSVYRVKSEADLPKHCKVAKVSPAGEVGKFREIPLGHLGVTKGKRTTVPTEHQEQVKVIEWCDAHPIAKHIFAIPNGSHKSPAMAAKFKREGLRSGVPDLFLPVPRGALAGLFIEMKRTKGAYSSQAQLEWKTLLTGLGYAVLLCKGADEAIKMIDWYLTTENV